MGCYDVLWYHVLSYNGVLVVLCSDIVWCRGFGCVVLYRVALYDSLVYREIVGVVWCVVWFGVVQ